MVGAMPMRVEKANEYQGHLEQTEGRLAICSTVTSSTHRAPRAALEREIPSIPPSPAGGGKNRVLANGSYPPHALFLKLPG
jgi:hypothetical protein